MRNDKFVERNASVFYFNDANSRIKGGDSFRDQSRDESCGFGLDFNIGKFIDYTYFNGDIETHVHLF